ncbi:MAG: hypothetical protein KF838_11705 [Phycisphaeraceae bacterium]|nr:MAG: hypothetical protein KF838_11705 [Phycisphaeraceae bacterium]
MRLTERDSRASSSLGLSGCVLVATALASGEVAAAPTVIPPGYTVHQRASGLPGNASAICMDPGTGAIFYDDSNNNRLYRVDVGGAIKLLRSFGATGSPPDSGPSPSTDMEFIDGRVYLATNRLWSYDATAINLFPTEVASVPGAASPYWGCGIAPYYGEFIVSSGHTGSLDRLTVFNLPGNSPSLPAFATVPARPSSLEVDEVNARCFISTNGSTMADRALGYVDIFTDSYTQLVGPGQLAGGIVNFDVDPWGDAVYIRESNWIRRVSVKFGTSTTFCTGFISTYEGDLTFGPSSDSSGGVSLYIADRTSIWEIRGFTQAPCPADYNGDTTADVMDFLDFLDDFGTCVGQWGPCGSWGNADFNGDTVVDVLDFLDFLNEFASGC